MIGTASRGRLTRLSGPDADQIHARLWPSARLADAMNIERAIEEYQVPPSLGAAAVGNEEVEHLIFDVPSSCSLEHDRAITSSRR